MTFTMATTIELNVARIKSVLRWFPGLVLGLNRQVGKTSAVLEVIHDDHEGQATVFCMNNEMREHTRRMYKDKYPNEQVPNFVSSTEKVQGRNDPIFADEWWCIPAEQRRDLLGTGRLVARIGTEFGNRNLDASVIRFTDKELDCLEAMFDVLINDGGHYMMLGLPETVKIHRDLFRKFRSAKGDGHGEGFSSQS